MQELSFRARRILYAAVTEYIAEGEPVGSRTLSKRYGLELSPATIRNVLADLEEAGFLAQPHTSAGRIPTDKGFRLFVDALVEVRELATEDRAAVVERMKRLRPGVDDVIREAGRLLSALTDSAAVVVTPRPEGEILAQMRFLPLRDGELLAVLVTKAGKVENRIVHVTLDRNDLESIHNYLDELVGGGHTLAEARDVLARKMSTERDHVDKLRGSVKAVLDAALASHEKADMMVIEGQSRLLERPEFADVEKMRALVHEFESKERLLGLLDRTLVSGGVQVVIGAETNLGAVQDVSLISAPYSQSGSTAGSISILGPTRMDYAKVVPLVSFTARMIGCVLDRKTDDES